MTFSAAIHLTFWASLSVLCLSACGSSDSPVSSDTAREEAAESRQSLGAREAETGAAAPTEGVLERVTSSDEEASKGPRIVFLGDSLTAGYGLDVDQAFPAVLQHRLESRGSPVQVVNAGVSGDTSAGGLRRLSWLLRQKPDLLVVGLGANDGLRGQSLTELEGNLRQIVSTAREENVDVLLLGMRMPPSLGPDYSAGFDAIYPRLAADFDLAFVPFLLDRVAARPELNQADGIHPNAEGARLLAETVEPVVLDWLKSRS